MPIQDPKDSRQMVPFHKLLQRCLEHPQLTMVIDDELFSETVIPQSKHDVDQCLPHHFFRHDHGSRHPKMMIGMTAIIEGGQSQIDGAPLFRSVAPKTLSDLRHHKSIEAADRMEAMVFCTSYRNQDDIIFLPTLDQLIPDRRLDVTSWLAEFRFRGDTIVSQNLINLRLRGIPNLLFQTAHRIVL